MGGLNFTIALNYGSRDEITRAARKLAKDCAAGKVNPDTIDESLFNSYLDTNDHSGSGFDDPYKRRTKIIELSALAAGLFRVLFYRYSVAGIYERRAYKSGGRI